MDIDELSRHIKEGRQLGVQYGIIKGYFKSVECNTVGINVSRQLTDLCTHATQFVKGITHLRHVATIHLQEHTATSHTYYKSEKRFVLRLSTKQVLAVLTPKGKACTLNFAGICT